MANNTIKFDIKAAVDTGGLDEFVSQLRALKDTVEPADRVLGDAVREIKAWAEASRLSERNTAAATTAIQALTGAMTAGGTEWRKATQAGNDLNKTLRETVNAATAAKAALAAPARTTMGASQQIVDMRKGLQELTIGSTQYLNLLQQITEKEALLGRRTGRAGVVAANQAFEGALLTRGYGAAENLQQMPDTTAALRQRLSELSQEFPNVIRGSERYLQISREMSAIERELARDLTGTTQALRQRSVATQAKIDAVRAYNEQAIRDQAAAGEISLAQRRRTAFGDVPQAMRSESGAFIAPPFKSSGYSQMGTMYPKPIGPQTALDYFESIKSQYNKPIGPQTALDYFESIKSQYNKPIGPQTPLDFWSSRISSGATQGPAAPSELFRSIGGIDTAGTTSKLQTMGRSYKEVAQQIRETAQAAGGSTRALQAERQAWEQLQSAVAPATREYRQAEREIRRVDRKLGSSRRGEEFLQSAGAISAGAFFGGPEGLIGGLAGMAIGGPGAALGGASIGAQLGIVRKSIGDAAVYSAELEKLRIALQGVTGGGTEYAKALDVVAAASNNLNIRQEDSLRGFTRLSASVIAAGGSVQEAKTVFDGVNTAIKATGGSSEQAQAALLALSQVFSKGKVSAEELSGQLGERLAGAVGLFAKATGRTLPQLNKDLKDGVVGLNDVLKFTEALGAKYAPAAERIAKSSEEAGARSAVALDKFRETIGRVFQPLGAQLQDSSAQFLTWATSVIQSVSGVNDEIAKVRVPRPQYDGRSAEQEAQRLIQGARARTATNQYRGFSNFVEITYGGQVYSGTPEEVRKALAQNLLLRAQAAERNAQSRPPNFPNPTSDKAKEDAAKEAEKQQKRQLEQQSQAQRLALQVYNDQVRLDEQRAENAIRLEDRVFQYRQELLRREREQVLQLDQLRQQTLIAGLSPEGRAAAAPISELLQRLQGISQNRQNLQDELAVAQQQLKSTQSMAAARQRYGEMYQSEDVVGAVVSGVGNSRINQNDPVLRSLATSRLAEGAAHYCVKTVLENMERLGRSNGRRELLAPTARGFGQGNDPRDAVITLASRYGWVPLPGAGRPVQLRSGAGQATVNAMTGQEYLNLQRQGGVPSGALMFSTINGSLNGSNRGSRGFDLAIVRDGGRSVFNFGPSRGPLAYGGNPAGQLVSILVPRSSLQGGSGSTGAPTTTTLPNGRTIRTPGAASAELRAASAAGDVEAAQAQVASLEELIRLDDKYRNQLSDQSVLYAVTQSTQSLRDQEQALRDNYQEWQIRNRLELENVKPELIEFEITKTRVLQEQARAMEGIAQLAKEFQPAFDKIGRGEEFRKFIAERTAGVQRNTDSILATQQQFALAQTDPANDWRRKMNALGQSTRDFNDTLKLAINLSDQLSSNLASGFSSAASAIITGNGSIQQSFADLFNNVAKMFIDTISRVLADRLTQYFLSLLRPGFNPYTSFFTDAASSITGAIGGAGFADIGGSVGGNFAPGLPQLAPAGITGSYGGFATGGVSSGPKSGYPVTLHGTEAIVPLPNGRAIPVEMKGSGATSVTVNVNMGTGESDVSSNERDGQMLGKALSEAVQAELIRQKRPGGLLYR